MQWKSDFEIEFKIIMKELNVERKRYLALNMKDRAIQILRSSSRKLEMSYRFVDISNIERSLQDHRQVMIKRSNVQSCYLFTFSSVYKVL